MDLKDSEYSRDILKKIQNAANKYSVVNVVLVIKGRSDADAVQQAAFYMGPLMRGIDVRTNNEMLALTQLLKQTLSFPCCNS